MKRSIFCSLPFLLASLAASAAAPGGQGIVRPLGGEAQSHCFKTVSQAVPEICGQFSVHWKLGTLMGEPVGNYGLVWSVRTVRLRNGDGKGAHNYALGDLPPALARAARGSELSMQALAFLQGHAAKLGTVGIAFDTGAPVRPDGKPSFNVPGSPDWSQLLILGSSNARGLPGWCEAKGRHYMPAEDAKQVMRAGVQLGHLQICPNTSASVDTLERAIDQYCDQSPNAGFCARQAAPAKADLLDQAADQPGIARKRTEMAQAHRRTAEAACARELAPLQACLRQACPAPQGPSDASCKAIPNRPSKGLGAILTASSSGYCDDACQRERQHQRAQRNQEREREDRAFAQQEQAWEAQWAGLARQCADSRQARAAQAQCSQNAERQCNPAGTTEQACLQARMASGPTEADAAAAVQQETRSRSQSGKRPSFLD